MPKWTVEQLQAIELSGQNIIVSAGAGSGKTAVLTERVLYKLGHGWHIDDLLILTFTNAAAKEMKERIRAKIEKQPFLKEERKRLDAAYITTFDSFTNALVKKYHYLKNISPTFKIVEPLFMEQKKKQLLDTILEHYYQQRNPQFCHFIDTFCPKNDQNIRKQILNISTKIELLHDKKAFFDEYDQTYFQPEKLTHWVNQYQQLTWSKISLLKDKIEQLEDGDYLAKVEASLSCLLSCQTLEEIKAIATIKLPVLPRNCSDTLKAQKEEIAKLLKEIQTMTSFKAQELQEQILSTQDSVHILLEILKVLEEQLDAYKFEQDLYEFQDIELLATQILEENKEIREHLKTQFKEIMIDEYQDTNDIQEYFISLLQTNNVYMVGDIKQAIYGFRNANPLIFKQKYQTYRQGTEGIKIDLTKNFRSRKEVIADINILFNEIMEEEIGGADYIQEHQMSAGNMLYEESGKTNQNQRMEIYQYPETKENKEEIEAFIIAKDIQTKIKENYQVFDMQLNQLRPVRYDDFAILVDRMTYSETYRKILEYHQLPITLYQDQSIQENDLFLLFANIFAFILSFGNYQPKKSQDYLYASIARSFLIAEEDETIFLNLKNHTYQQQDWVLTCSHLAQTIQDQTVTMIIDEIIDLFQIEEKLLQLDQIEQHLAILTHLRSLASQMTQIGYQPYQFLQYLEDLIEEKREIKIPTLPLNENSIKMMTIHKSKGLEFPICYFPGLSKSFNLKDASELFSYHSNYGIILPFDQQGIQDTILKTLLRQEYLKDQIGEKIRLFYVALTRAKEKMIFITSLKEQEGGKVTNEKRMLYRSYKQVLESIYPKIKDKIREIDLSQYPINKAYLKKKILSIKTENTTSISVSELQKDTNIIQENHFSKTIATLLTEEEKKAMQYGTSIHEKWQTFDFSDFENNSLENQKQIAKLIQHPELQTMQDANIYQELEFFYQEEEKENHGIIDLLIEWEKKIIILDYKLKNLDDPAYQDQLKGYQKVIQKKTKKQVDLYLYSIMNDQLQKVE